MPHRGKIWTERDRYGNEVYLTWERWEDHILPGHPTMEGQLEKVRRTIQEGRRWQDPLNPNRYHYRLWDVDLPEDYNCIVVVVIVTPAQNERFVVTAYLDELPERG
ncbi:MAG TPA: hypothetical protein VJ793_03955 [Anaerolineae bacterium]|nr:hypothetical protein [Anaerolineae bacterium]